MTKRTKKLVLAKETLGELQELALGHVVAGLFSSGGGGVIDPITLKKEGCA